MKQRIARKARTQLILLAAGLMLLAGLAVVTLVPIRPGPPRLARAGNGGGIDPSAVERGAFQVTLPTQREATVYFTQSRSTNAPKVVFEPDGNRVWVRAVPRGSAGK